MSNQNKSPEIKATDVLFMAVGIIAAVGIAARIKEDGLENVAVDAFQAGVSYALGGGLACAAIETVTSDSQSGQRAEKVINGFSFGLKLGAVSGLLAGALLGTSASETE